MDQISLSNEMLKELLVATSLCDHPMAPARVSWRVRFAELMEDCEASVPEEAGGLGRKGYSGVQGSGAHVGDWEGGY